MSHAHQEVGQGKGKQSSRAEKEKFAREHLGVKGDLTPAQQKAAAAKQLADAAADIGARLQPLKTRPANILPEDWAPAATLHDRIAQLIAQKPLTEKIVSDAGNLVATVPDQVKAIHAVIGQRQAAAAKAREEAAAARTPANEATPAEWAPVVTLCDQVVAAANTSPLSAAKLTEATTALAKIPAAKASAGALAQARLQADAKPLRDLATTARTVDPNCTAGEWAPVVAICDTIAAKLGGPSLTGAGIAEAKAASGTLHTAMAQAKEAGQQRLRQEAAPHAAAAAMARTPDANCIAGEWAPVLQLCDAVASLLSQAPLTQDLVTAAKAKADTLDAAMTKARQAAQARLQKDAADLRKRVTPLAKKDPNCTDGEWAPVLKARDQVSALLEGATLIQANVTLAQTTFAGLPGIIEAAKAAAQQRLRQAAAPFQQAAADARTPDIDTNAEEWQPVLNLCAAIDKALGAKQLTAAAVETARRASEGLDAAKTDATAAAQARMAKQAAPLRKQALQMQSPQGDATAAEWATVLPLCKPIIEALQGPTLSRQKLDAAASTMKSLDAEVTKVAAVVQARLGAEATKIIDALPKADSPGEDATDTERRSATAAVAAVKKRLEDTPRRMQQITDAQSLLAAQQKTWDDIRTAIQVRLAASRDALRATIATYRKTLTTLAVEQTQRNAINADCDAAEAALPTTTPLTGAALQPARIKGQEIGAKLKELQRQQTAAQSATLAPYREICVESGESAGKALAAAVEKAAADLKTATRTKDAVIAELKPLAEAAMQAAWTDYGVVSRDKLNKLTLATVTGDQRKAVGETLTTDEAFLKRGATAARPLAPPTLDELRKRKAELDRITEELCTQIKSFKERMDGAATKTKEGFVDAIARSRLLVADSAMFAVVTQEADAEIDLWQVFINESGGMPDLAKPAKGGAATTMPPALAALQADVGKQLEFARTQIKGLGEIKSKKITDVLTMEQAVKDPTVPYTANTSANLRTSCQQLHEKIDKAREARQGARKAIADLVASLGYDSAGGNAAKASSGEILLEIRSAVEKGLSADRAKRIEADLTGGKDYPIGVWRRALKDGLDTENKEKAARLAKAQQDVAAAPWVTWAERFGMTATSREAKSWGLNDTGQVNAFRYVPEAGAAYQGVPAGWRREAVAVQTHATALPLTGSPGGNTPAAIVAWFLGTNDASAHVTAEVYGGSDGNDPHHRKNPKVYVGTAAKWVANFKSDLNAGPQPAGLVGQMEAIRNRIFGRAMLEATAKAWLEDGLSEEAIAQDDKKRKDLLAELNRRIAKASA